jgi:uncharacterized protein (DUF2235 family)
MGKNIVLCSDGTGNKGGTGSDTNVFRIYHAIHGGKSEREQIAFYDNGVGTASHAVFRAIGGATGFGFKRNVRDLYEFASRHYQDDDDIYAFGFSRGAATIRAFAGMVQQCGLVQRKIDMTETEFQRQVDAAMASYLATDKQLSLGRLWDAIVRRDRKFDGHGVKIEFLGLWDTVAALGFPQIPWLDRIVGFFRRHHFYNLEPRDVVNTVAHAIAVDDERRTFWPLVWDETRFGDDQHIEQVWFPGVHSNVGGGYPRPGLANVALDWMIARLEAHRHSMLQKNLPDRGLKIELSFLEEVRDGMNPYGKMYDSRAGFALFYRYQPRPIEHLCKGRMRGSNPIRIHESVLERMVLRTAGYGPGQLPDKFVEVRSRTEDLNAFATQQSPQVRTIDLNEPEPDGTASIWPDLWKGIDKNIYKRIGLYWALLGTTLLLLSLSVFFWAGEVEYGGYGEAWRQASWWNGALGHIADILNYVLPDLFRNIINYGVLKSPWWVVGLSAAIGVYYLLRARWRKQSDTACDTARQYVLQRRRT